MIKVESISVAEFAKKKNISTSRVTLLIQQGRIKAYKQGKLWRITSLEISPPKFRGRPPKK